MSIATEAIIIKEPMESPAQEWKWNDAVESPQDLVETATDEDYIRPAPSPNTAADNSQFTKLRRRIEERLDSKRIALEYDYD